VREKAQIAAVNGSCFIANLAAENRNRKAENPEPNGEKIQKQKPKDKRLNEASKRQQRMGDTSQRYCGSKKCQNPKL